MPISDFEILDINIFNIRFEYQTKLFEYVFFCLSKECFCILITSKSNLKSYIFNNHFEYTLNNLNYPNLIKSFLTLNNYFFVFNLTQIKIFWYFLRELKLIEALYEEFL